MRLPGGSERRRAGLLGAFLACALLACGPAASAETVLGRWGLRPRYETQYKVYKQETGWTQKFNLDRTSSWADLRTFLTVESKEDETRNDFRYGNNIFQLDLSRKGFLGTLSAGSGTQRLWTQTSQSLDSRRKDDVSLSDLLSLVTTETRKLSLALGGGWVEERQNKEGRRGATATSDRTVATGWAGEARLDGEWAPEEDLKLTAQASWDGSLESSSSVHSEGAEQTRHEDTDRSRTNGLAADLVWTRHAALNLAAKMSYSDAVAQYYQASAEAQETKRSELHSFQMEAAGKPLETLDYRLEVKTRKSAFDHEVEANDRLDTGTDYHFTTKYLPGLPLISGSTLQGDAGYSTKRAERERTVPYDSKTTRLEFRFARPLGSHFNLTFKTGTLLEQDFYDDGSLDKDRLRTSTSSALHYKVEKRIRVGATYAANRTDVVNIRAARAGQNQVEKDYRYTLEYNWFLPAGIQVSQNFQVSAAYTYYVYNEASNSLTRMNRVSSTANVPLWEGSKIDVEHIFERSDTGAYLYGESGGKTYRPATERLRQDLKATVTYKLSSMITLGLIERLGLNSSKQLSSGVVTPRTNHDISAKVSLQRDLPGDLKLSATFERTESKQVDPFWRIDAKVQKQFD